MSSRARPLGSATARNGTAAFGKHPHVGRINRRGDATPSHQLGVAPAVLGPPLGARRRRPACAGGRVASDQVAPPLACSRARARPHGGAGCHVCPPTTQMRRTASGGTVLPLVWVCPCPHRGTFVPVCRRDADDSPAVLTTRDRCYRRPRRGWAPFRPRLGLRTPCARLRAGTSLQLDACAVMRSGRLPGAEQSTTSGLPWDE